MLILLFLVHKYLYTKANYNMDKEEGPKDIIKK